MSHYRITSNNLQESETSSTRRASAFDSEAPLPTYDEAVGTTSTPGFKADVLLPQYPPRTALRTERNEINSSNHNPRDNSMKKKLLIVSLGFIILPMCIMIIILQVKVCATSRVEAQEETDRVSHSYRDCTTEKQNLINEFDRMNVKYEKSLDTIKDLNDDIRKLKQEMQRLLVSMKKSHIVLPNFKESTNITSQLEYPTDIPFIRNKNEENSSTDSYLVSKRFPYDSEIQKVIEETADWNRLFEGKFPKSSTIEESSTSGLQIKKSSESTIDESDHHDYEHYKDPLPDPFPNDERTNMSLDEMLQKLRKLYKIR